MRLLLSTLVAVLTYGNANFIRTYQMDDYCDKSISMITSSFQQAAIKLDASTSFNQFPTWSAENECIMTLEAWFSRDNIGFYFDYLDLPCDYGYLAFYDGERHEKVIEGLDHVCNDVIHGGQYKAASRRLKIKFVRVSSVDYQHQNVMNLIVTAFHEGNCESYEYNCGNGRCIDDSLSCNGYKSCGDGNSCHWLSSGAVAGIVIGALAGMALVVTLIVVLCCCRRRRKLPTTMMSTAATRGQVVYVAQAIPAVSLNAPQQPPPYSIAQPQSHHTYNNTGFQHPEQKTSETTN